MAKKFVRGITDVKTINKQDFDTNNVNDLLSDGQYNYIHRKKGKGEEYHNLTDNIKTISSDNTDLLTVTNNNKTTNTATLHPKHDAQKEQVLESERNTVTINHGTNGTAEKTKVDTNPQKVLEHENLTVDYGISKSTSGNTTKLGLEYTKVEDNFDLNNLMNGCVRSSNFINSPQENTWFFVSAYSEGEYTIQDAITLTDNENTTFRRVMKNNVWGDWREQVGDKSAIDSLLAQKQNKLSALGGLSITGDNISMTVVDQYTGDLNDLTYTSLARPKAAASNLPVGDNGEGILTTTRIGFTVTQQYYTLSGDKLYIRIGRNLDTSPKWTVWTLLTAAQSQP